MDARQIASFLKAPGSSRVVLLYGDDEGLIRDRSQALTRAIAGSLNDPFLTAELSKDGWGRIVAEVASLSMIGGRRVVIVREVSDALHATMAEVLRGPGNALLILEAVGLGKGKLRSLVETSADAAAIACYPEEGRALTDYIRGWLKAGSVEFDDEIIDWIAETSGGSRGTLRNELEKLILYGRGGATLTLDDAKACLDGNLVAGDDSLTAATDGDLQRADRVLESAIAHGMAEIALLRVALTHLQKMHQARLRMDTGMAVGDAVRATRPPIYFKAATSMATSVRYWPAKTLLSAIEELRQVEVACKQTGSRPDLMTRRFVQTLTRAGRALRRAPI